VKPALAIALLAVACGRSGFDVDASDAVPSDGVVVHPSDANFVFLTSSLHSPVGLTLQSADDICNARATAAGLPGTYVAWLSTSTVAARNRVGTARGWVRPDGRPFSDRVEDILAGVIYYPIALDESGAPVGAQDPVITGSNAYGTTANNCTNFTMGSPDSAAAGDPLGTAGAWATSGTMDCGVMGRLACFGTTKSIPLVFAPATGRRAFQSVQLFTPAAGGLASADALCNSEASLAGIGSSYRALLATTANNMSSRLDLTGAPWVRLDGVALADTPLAFISNQIRTTLNVTSTKSYVMTTVFTGATDPTMIAPDGFKTCGDWTGSAANALIGAANRTDAMFYISGGASCSPQPIYCLEE
jgi:hypothetical protein